MSVNQFDSHQPSLNHSTKLRCDWWLAGDWELLHLEQVTENSVTPGAGDRTLLHLEQVIDNCYTWSRWLKTLLHLEQVTENFATPGVGDCELCYTWIRSDFSLTCFTCWQMFYFWFIWLCFSSPSQSLSQLFCKNFNITFGKKTKSSST